MSFIINIGTFNKYNIKVYIFVRIKEIKVWVIIKMGENLYECI